MSAKSNAGLDICGRHTAFKNSKEAAEAYLGIFSALEIGVGVTLRALCVPHASC